MVSILDFLFPKKCVGCGKLGNYVCDSCKKLQGLHFPNICPICEKSSIDGRTHTGCKTPLSLDGATFIFRYQKPISGLLKQLKYRFGKDLKEIIVSWSVKELKRFYTPRNATLVPVPLHALRQNWRGFNQAEILGEEISKRMEWDYRFDILLRTKIRKEQSRLGEKARKQNVRGIFSTSAHCLVPSNLVLFDDVWTTGSTIKEACKVLKRKGVKFVWALTIAR